MIKLILMLYKCRTTVLLGLSSFFILAQASANQCLQSLPAGTIKNGLPKLCQSDFSGSRQEYACQDYRAGEQRFRVLYKGGLTPKAVLKLNARKENHHIEVISQAEETICPLPVPKGVPPQASHLGTGVCADSNDQSVPCSLYKHTEARQPNIYRYMVFYKTNTQGLTDTLIDIQLDDGDQDAMAAEVAYQIGMSLSRTDCCAQQATDYLAYAYHLYPHSKIYRNAYQVSIDNINEQKVSGPGTQQLMTMDTE